MAEELSVVPQIAFKILEEVSQSHNKASAKLSDEALVKLHSVFGNVLLLAAELLDSCKITRYQTEDNCRKIYKIGNYKEFHTIYEQINFCNCQSFRFQVLEARRNLTCKHVLAVRLNQIIYGEEKIKIEIVSGSQFVEFLNEQLNYVEELE